MSRKTVAEKFQNEGYEIAVTGRNVLVTDAMKDYALEKLSKVDRLGNRVIDMDVVMDIQKLVHHVDIVMKVDTVVIRSSASSDNMYASIDKASHRLQQQLLRYKDRIQKYHARGASAVDVTVNIIESAKEAMLEEVNAEIEEKNSEELMATYQPHKIVSQETMRLKHLNDEEALMKMELSGDEFMVYRDDHSRKTKVIYRRDDGNFGIIEPDK
jgi:putative sigma-54 modulation protein